MGGGCARRPRPRHTCGRCGRQLGCLPDGSSPTRSRRGTRRPRPWGPLADRAEQFASATELGLVPDPDAVRAVWEDAVTAPGWAGQALWIHGDLHPANILTMDGDGRVQTTLRRPPGRPGAPAGPGRAPRSAPGEPRPPRVGARDGRLLGPGPVRHRTGRRSPVSGPGHDRDLQRPARERG
nr:phosphotransferase [Streptomyces sp. RLB1-33]